MKGKREEQIELQRETNKNNYQEIKRNEELDLDIPFIKPQMSIEECRNILSTDGEEYSDQEITEIRTLLLNLVEIDYKMYQKQKKRLTDAKVIHLIPEETIYKKAV